MNVKKWNKNMRFFNYSNMGMIMCLNYVNMFIHILRQYLNAINFF